MPQDATQIVVAGTGKVMVAPVGTTQPTDPFMPWPAGWVDLGYTSDAGVKFHDDKKLLDIMVWQKFYPARRQIIGRDSSLMFALMQWSGSGVTFAYGGGIVTATAGLTTPAAPTAATATTGGTLVAGTYAYRVTALNAVGESLPSPEVTQVVPNTTTTNTVTVTWTAVTGATGYKVYGRAVGAELLLATVGNVLTYTDTGAATPAGAMPVANSSGYYNYAPPSPGVTDSRALGIEWTDGAYQFRLLAANGIVSGAVDAEIVRTKPSELACNYGLTGPASGPPFNILTNHPAFAS